MNVFVLCTGRCGSTTFAKACAHITNYTAGHQTNMRVLGVQRLVYPRDHIEVDNRLSWFLGRLDVAYGRDAFYVHLTRDNEAVVSSFVNRFDKSIVRAHGHDVVFDANRRHAKRNVCLDYVWTVGDNIKLFLKDKQDVCMPIDLADAKELFPEFWRRIGAQGNLEAALAEFDVKYNATRRKPKRARR
jgi:hypothetical protein